MKKKWIIGLVCATLSVQTLMAETLERLPGYVQAEKFTKEKLNTMLFSTTVDPHWFQQGNRFWYEYKTSNGRVWYVVDPVMKKKTPLFNLNKLASEITEIVKDPFTAQQLPIEKLEAQPDGKTFTFQITSSKEAPKDSIHNKDGKKKQVFYFSYNYPEQKLTWLEEQKEDVKYPDWASFSPDGKTVVYAKDLNLYWMSRADYEKAKVNEKDSTIVETALTTDGVRYYGYGEPYSVLNTDTLCNGKRRYPDNLLWSPDSKRFIITKTDMRKVKELWVINAMASPRPTLETYKYQMPGEKEAPEEHPQQPRPAPHRHLLLYTRPGHNRPRDSGADEHLYRTAPLSCPQRWQGARPLERARWLGASLPLR